MRALDVAKEVLQERAAIRRRIARMSYYDGCAEVAGLISETNHALEKIKIDLLLRSIREVSRQRVWDILWDVSDRVGYEVDDTKKLYELDRKARAALIAELMYRSSRRREPPANRRNPGGEK